MMGKNQSGESLVEEERSKVCWWGRAGRVQGKERRFLWSVVSKVEKAV